MPQTLAQSFYLGPFAIYTSPTGLTDGRTGIPMLGGTMHEGDYVDLGLSEAAQWNARFGVKLNTGRYRLVRVTPASTPALVVFGKPAAWGLPTYVGQLAIAAGGTGATADGTYTIRSTTSGGTAVAVGLATVSGGIIVAVQLSFAGANFTSVPTFPLTEIAGLTGGSVLAQMLVSPSIVSSFDGAAQQLSSPRGVFLNTTAPTQAQVTAGCYVVIQEEGIAPILVTTATATAAGSVATAATGAGITTTTAATASVAGFLGYTLDLAAANTVIRVDLALPVRQG